MKIGICFGALLIVILLVMNTGPTVPPDSGGAPSIAEPGPPSDTPLQASQETPRSEISPSPPDDSELPEMAPSLPKQDEIELWQADQSEPDTMIDGNPAKRMRTNPGALEQLHVGQALRLDIPQRGEALEAVLESTSNHTSKIHVWRGRILQGHSQDNIIITRGEIETHVVIATREGTYSAVIDNQTGETVIIDQGDIVANQIPYDDGIPIEPIEDNPPPMM